MQQLGLVDKVGNIFEEEKNTPAQQKRIRIVDFKAFHEDRARKELNHKEETIAIYNNAFDSFISIIGNKYVDEILVDDVRHWRDALAGERPDNKNSRKKGKANKKRVHSKTSISIWARAQRAAWNRAIKEGYAKHNPFLDVPWPGPTETRRLDKNMSVSQVEKLLDKTLQRGEKQFWLFLQFAINTGLRRSELLRIKGKDIDMEKRELTVLITKKRGEPMRLKVPINKNLHAILAQTDIKVDEYVFKTNAHNRKYRDKGQPWSRRHVTRKFRKLADEVGLPKHFTLHSCRHTFVTYLHEKGIATHVIQRLIGHSSPSITLLEYDGSDALVYAPFADQMDIGAKKLDDEA